MSEEHKTGATALPAFVSIPYNVFTDDTLSHASKLVYGRLKLYAGKDGRCCPKHETLAREVCIGTTRRLRAVLDELRENGWIEWHRSRTSCVYTVHSDRKKRSDLNHETGRKVPITSEENFLSRSEENFLQKKRTGKEVFENKNGAARERIEALREFLDMKPQLGRSPDDRILRRIVAALGDTPLELFKAVVLRRVRKLRPESYAIFELLAKDARAEYGNRERKRPGEAIGHRMIYEAPTVTPDASVSPEATTEQAVEAFDFASFDLWAIENGFDIDHEFSRAIDAYEARGQAGTGELRPNATVDHASASRTPQESATPCNRERHRHTEAPQNRAARGGMRAIGDSDFAFLRNVPPQPDGHSAV